MIDAEGNSDVTEEVEVEVERWPCLEMVRETDDGVVAMDYGTISF